MDQALLDRVNKQSWVYRYPRGWPLLLFIIASIGTAVSVMAIERADRQTRQVEVDRNLTETASSLQRRITENIALLRAASALFATQGDVSEAQFAEFADDLQANGSLYGSLGLGWAPLVPVDRLGEFEAAQIEKNPDSGFFVTPRPEAGQIYATPIVYLEPHSTKNQAAIGYDMYSERTRRAAMDLAMRLGKPVASGKVHLVQDREQPDAAGFLIYMPVIVTENGRDVVKGFVYSPFRADEFLASAAELDGGHQVDAAIYDGTSEDPEHLLAARGDPQPDGARTIHRQIDVGSHSWLVAVNDKQTSLLSPMARITLFFGALTSLLVMAIGRLITRRAAEDRRVLEWLTSQAAIRNSLTRELNHRVKNTLANVLSILALTRRGATSLDDFIDRFSSRVRALSTTHDLLSQTNWRNAALGDVIHSELAPYMQGSEDHVEISGPQIDLAPNDAMSLGLAIHELATNAAKYGALSTPDGRIKVSWELVEPTVAQIDWREEGGPPVVEPRNRGFGRHLIEKIVAHELKAPVELTFAPGGVECRLRVPVRTARDFNLRNKGNRDQAAA